MFRMSGTLFRDGHPLRSCVSRQTDAESRTSHVFTALREICEYMDLQVPIWLDNNIREFQRKGKTKFLNDSFTEEIPFDYLEIEIIEEG